MAEERRMEILERDNEEMHRSIVELNLRVLEISIRQEEILKKMDNYNSGINRGLWIIGGGFILAFVTWITGGGLESSGK